MNRHQRRAAKTRAEKATSITAEQADVTIIEEVEKNQLSFPGLERETLKVHPAADVFPMMTQEELIDLAEDIKEHGLLCPIVLTEEGLLADGRNRSMACRIAGVEPTAAVFAFPTNPVSWIAASLRSTSIASAPASLPRR
jgi:hypothetical protein